MKVIHNFFSVLRNFDWLILALVLVLVSIGLASIYSIDLSRGETSEFFSTQLLATILGLVLFFVAGVFHIAFYRSLAKPLYLVSVILLISVLFLGSTIRGTTGWFRIGGLSFQPAEFAKLGMIVFQAWWISKQARRFDRWQFVLTSGFFTAVMVCLIALQPDLGSALVMFGIWFGLLFSVGTKKRFLFLLVAGLLAVFLLGWFFFFKGYQKERFSTFIDPGRDPLGSGYNVTQSMIAIGSGKFLGRGLGFGSQSQLHFLPESQTDFIFSVIAEELGFLGTSAVLLFYFFLLWRLLIIAKKSRDDFSAYLVLGVLLLYFIQIIINIGGATGLLPITGVTLPFLSYGGSSLLINFLLLGIVESVARGGKSRHPLSLE
ncbi:rod shape-determining protein RodA [Patescibacteria group bacterium]|nr:rod shape-determining protein RodA [Patescibacteria group bacterium]